MARQVERDDKIEADRQEVIRIKQKQEVLNKEISDKERKYKIYKNKN